MWLSYLFLCYYHFFNSLFLIMFLTLLTVLDLYLCKDNGGVKMTIKRTLIAFLFLLMPLTTYALPISNMPSMNSNITLFFFNTLYSSRLLSIISNDTCLLSSTITNQYSGILKGSLPQQPSKPFNVNVSCNINSNQPTTHPAPVPEPATLLLLGVGLLGLAGFRKKTIRTDINNCD